MNQEELLNLYLEKLRLYATQKMEEESITALEALKVSLVYIEGEMSGY